MAALPALITIPLTQGKAAVVDACDAELARHRWCARTGPQNRTYYAVRKARRAGGRATTEALHRAVWKRAHPGEPIPAQLDHVNGDGLDCRRENLRAATPAQNARNRPRSRANVSGYLGVSLKEDRKRLRPWCATIEVAGRQAHIGYYSTPEEAARARDEAARQHFGGFAVLNFPVDRERSARAGGAI